MKLKNFCIALTALFLIAGCGERRVYSPTEMVEGIVTLDGVPVEGVDVTFYPVDSSVGHTATGRTDANGRYTLSSITGAPGRGTTAGEYRVVVSLWVTRELDEPFFDRAQDMVISSVSEEMLPRVYTDDRTTPLTVTVNSGNNVIDLELSSTAVSRQGR